MKNLIIGLLVTILAGAAEAAIVPGTYTGVVKYTMGAKKKTWSKKRDITIYVQLENENNTDFAYGLMLDHDQDTASLYRIDELPDGNQLWIQMYQGNNNVLRVNEAASPDFTGNVSVSDRSARLILRPTEQRVRCGEGEVEVTLSNDSSWRALPNKVINFKMKGGSSSVYSGSTFNGTLNLNGVVHTGVVHLTPVLKNVATIRRSVVDQKTLSGYRQEREIIGLVTNIGSRKDNLLFIGLPVGSRQCSYGTQTMRQE